MSTGEYAFARADVGWLYPASMAQRCSPHFRKHGLVTAEMQEKIQERKTYYTRLVPTVPTSYQRLQDQQAIQIGKHAWRVITGFGHSPEHVSLYCAELNCLISGDMLLPASPPMCQCSVEPEANPVKLYRFP